MYVLLRKLFALSVSVFVAVWVRSAVAEQVTITPAWLQSTCADCAGKMRDSTGMVILDRGEESLLARAWLVRNATRSIDIQYFIWSTDNIGILASAELLDAADRGVRVRVLVDDFLIDAADSSLLALAAHDKVEIRIYNPQHSVGTSFFRRLVNMLTNFRGLNQRMHDKTAIFDGVVGITGGRNMADEYYDYDHVYNFRDRDALLIGGVVPHMSENFNEFWLSELAVPVQELLADELLAPTRQAVLAHREKLKEYAREPGNFAPQVRAALENLSQGFPRLAAHVVWGKVDFISDVPGKNPNRFQLDGGGESTSLLTERLAGAPTSVLIQSPYLVLPEGGIELLADLVRRGVRVRISTNSLASTDNVMAFSGYYGQREALLDAGVEIYEFKPNAAIRAQLAERADSSDTVFAIHAKSMVLDREQVYIGTFNLDPRSANLNTEVGVLVSNKQLGEELATSIEADMLPANSWEISPTFNPDNQVPWFKRFLIWFLSLLPLHPVL
jgi:putative cardiolipin synthase